MLLYDSNEEGMHWATFNLLSSNRPVRESELNRKYGAAVKKTAANILRDRLDVEECVNDTYLRTWNSIPPQKPNPLVEGIQQHYIDIWKCDCNRKTGETGAGSHIKKRAALFQCFT